MKIQHRIVTHCGSDIGSVVSKMLVLIVNAGSKSGTKLTYPGKCVPTVHCN